LWTRAADIDPRNDVATYNLAVALAAAGREDEAADAYRRTIALVPDHDLARHNLAVLQAARAEREADQLAGAGRTEEAAAQYTRALQLDERRPHAHAALGTLLARQGHFERAAVELDLALSGGVTDVEVPNTLAFALRQLGNDARAAEVLDRALAAHAGDVNLEHNLARLLATSPNPRARNAPRAVQLALDVCERTRNRDARALDTLAAAYAANGQFDRARTTAARAVARAREIGDAAIAAEIADHAAAYGALTRSGVSRP
jgi:Flp pilus assembly protein TadD